MDSSDLDSTDDDDPIVAEVRRVREWIAQQCDYDIDRIADYCRQQTIRARQEREHAQIDE